MGCLLRYMDEQGLVSVKGQVAAHIQSADELVLSELIFQGAFKVRGGWADTCFQHALFMAATLAAPACLSWIRR